MRKAIAVLGIVGLGVAWGSVSATAAPATRPPGGLICHANEAGTYEPFFVSSHGMIMDLNGHKGHLEDIIPFPGYGGSPTGQNMTPENVAILNNGCIGAVAKPGGNTVAVPKDATVLAPPGAVNPGYNVDGAVPAESGSAIPLWLAAATGIPALAALVVWRIRVRTRSASR